MASTTNELSYRDMFTAIGKFIAEKKLQDVCVLEYEDGMIVSGSALYEGGHTILRRAEETFVFTTDDLRRMIGATGTLSQKRGLFGR